MVECSLSLYQQPAQQGVTHGMPGGAGVINKPSTEMLTNMLLIRPVMRFWTESHSAALHAKLVQLIQLLLGAFAGETGIPGASRTCLAG